MFAISHSHKIISRVLLSNSRILPTLKAIPSRHFSEESDDLVIDIANLEAYNNYKKDEKPSVVCFSSKKDEECRKIAPLFSFFSTKVPEASFLKIDITENPSIAEVEGVTKVPTYKLFKKNELLLDFVGASGVQLMEMIEMAQTKKA